MLDIFKNRWQRDKWRWRVGGKEGNDMRGGQVASKQPGQVGS